MEDNYKKWSRMKFEDLKDDLDPTEFAIKLLNQPPFKHDIKYYNDNYPCPEPCYAHLYQMTDAGWEQDCIDFKLRQVVHYSDGAIQFRKMMEIKNQTKALESKEETEIMLEQIKRQENLSNVLEEENQQLNILQDNLFPDHFPKLKREHGRVYEKEELNSSLFESEVVQQSLDFEMI